MVMERGFELIQQHPDNQDYTRLNAIRQAESLLKEAHVKDVSVLGSLKIYRSQLQGIAVIWRNGEINCYNLAERLHQEDLQFVDRLGGIQYRLGSFGSDTLEYLDKDDLWRVCENGEHQIYFDLLMQEKELSKLPQIGF